MSKEIENIRYLIQDNMLRQIEHNRKVSERMDVLEGLLSALSHLRHIDKKPHKCPVCEGQGGFYISGTMDSECHACEGKGIVWG